MSGTDPVSLLLKYDSQVPRYTSYPPAPHFNRDPEAIDAEGMLTRSNAIGRRNASIYFHIPFCPKRCHFCGCHTEIGRPGAAIREYLDTLLLETDLVLPRIDRGRPVTQIHFGGGTPNAAPFGALSALLDRVRTHLRLESGAEVAIECDPNLITTERIAELADMGFTRISFGIQDFNLTVLNAVNRRFPKTAPKELFRVCRGLGMKGNNLDLIYGLPFQTRESFKETIAKTIDADPDRISLFPYAHVPWVKGHQAILDQYPMPDATARLEIAWAARESLVAAGYEAIGMDHFAKPGDDLAIAVREGALHRNFQGYCHAGRAGQVYALGSSAISQYHEGYLQNAKDLGEYTALVRSGKPGWKSGYRMRPEDIAVRAIIEGLLCTGRAEPDAAFREAGVAPDWSLPYQAASLRRLAPLLADGLAAWDGKVVSLEGDGQYVARAAAAAFDPMLASPEAGSPAPRYSRAL